MNIIFKLKTWNRIGLLCFISFFYFNSVRAQRFPHGGGGGGIHPQGGGDRGGMVRPGGGDRGSMGRPPGAENNRPSGVSRPPINIPRTFNQPQRDFNMPNRGSINGGAINPGNHNFNNRPPMINHDNNPGRFGNPNRGRDNINAYHQEGFGFRSQPYFNHPYHPYYWGPRWHPFGFFLGSLAFGAFAFTLANQNYYYDEGVYYQPYNSGYRVVSAPIGAIIDSLPDGYESINLGDQFFFYFAGIFYVEVQGGFQVVRAPLGAVVSQIPEGAEGQYLHGENVLVYNNTYFLPISQDGEDAYQVVQP